MKPRRKLRVLDIPMLCPDAPPDRGIGGVVYLMQHGRLWSVNYQNGDGGWQSHRSFTRTTAEAIARELAEFWGAELER